ENGADKGQEEDQKRAAAGHCGLLCEGLRKVMGKASGEPPPTGLATMLKCSTSCAPDARGRAISNSPCTVFPASTATGFCEIASVAAGNWASEKITADRARPR